MPDFVDAVLAEGKRAAATHDLHVRTIYLGGGTPTALSETHLERLLAGLTDIFSHGPLDEFGIEANPMTVTPSKAAMLRRSGITRVSLGVQAWDDETLKTLGRDHSPAEAEETYQILRAAGLASVNIDLMFSIPGQTLDVWDKTLDRTLTLKPDHISAYNLNYEEDTDFFDKLTRGLYKEEPERDADMFFGTIDQLEAAGYEHYEISNYAKPGHQSAHNAGYWLGNDYLGLGPSAVSTVGRTRWKNMPDTAQYIHAVKVGIMPRQDAESLSHDQWLTERIALELRTNKGVERSRLSHVPLAMLEQFITSGHLTTNNTHIMLTKSGRALADTLAAELLPGVY